VLDEDVGQAAIRRKLADQADERCETAGGGTDADDGRFTFLTRDARPGCFPEGRLVRCTIPVSGVGRKA
jgi:hypothetical protein